MRGAPRGAGQGVPRGRGQEGGEARELEQHGQQLQQQEAREQQRQAQLTAEADGMTQRGLKIRNNGIGGMTIFSMARKGLVQFCDGTQGINSLVLYKQTG